MVVVSALILAGMAASVYREELKTNLSWYFLDKTGRPLEAFAQKCFMEFPAKTATQKIVNLRHCVNINSAFSADPVHKNKWQNPEGMMQWLAKYSRHETADPPPMDCYYRAHAMSWILKSLGLESYVIVVTDNRDNFMDHVFVRVKNPDTNEWEIQDPLYDMAYKSRKRSAFLDFKKLLTYPVKDIEPCDFTGNCGWDLVSREKLNISQIESYLSSAYDTQEKTLYISRNFDEKKIRNVRGAKINFCQKRPDYCNKIVELKALP